MKASTSIRYALASCLAALACGGIACVGEGPDGEDPLAAELLPGPRLEAQACYTSCPKGSTCSGTCCVGAGATTGTDTAPIKTITFDGSGGSASAVGNIICDGHGCHDYCASGCPQFAATISTGDESPPGPWNYISASAATSVTATSACQCQNFELVIEVSSAKCSLSPALCYPDGTCAAPGKVFSLPNQQPVTIRRTRGVWLSSLNRCTVPAAVVELTDGGDGVLTGYCGTDAIAKATFTNTATGQKLPVRITAGDGDHPVWDVGCSTCK